MSKIIINTQAAPAAIGAYSQAVRVADTVYISGQIPLDPDTMEVVSQEFEQQARQVFKNLIAVADAAGGSLADAVKLTVYLTDLTDFAALNTIMAAYISEPFPARAAVQVAALPKGVQIEIDAVLYLA
ncbi:MAG: reactive intermediate/imine deaminase [Arenicella sp.]|jgi:reactive intermediate/imine deaminase